MQSRCFLSANFMYSSTQESWRVTYYLSPMRPNGQGCKKIFDLWVPVQQPLLANSEDISHCQSRFNAGNMLADLTLGACSHTKCIALVMTLG